MFFWGEATQAHGKPPGGFAKHDIGRMSTTSYNNTNTKLLSSSHVFDDEVVFGFYWAGLKIPLHLSCIAKNDETLAESALCM